MEARGRLQQASETRSDIEEYRYYTGQAFDRMTECLEAIMDALEEADDEALLE